jgi:hypothetical protein
MANSLRLQQVANSWLTQTKRQNPDSESFSVRDDKISKQAFFTYFYVSEEAMAARGKGGGIALWSRVKNN